MSRKCEIAGDARYAVKYTASSNFFSFKTVEKKRLLNIREAMSFDADRIRPTSPAAVLLRPFAYRANCTVLEELYEPAPQPFEAPPNMGYTGDSKRSADPAVS